MATERMMIMIMMKSLLLVLLLSVTTRQEVSAADSARPCQNYLDMSDEDLFYAASEGRRIGDYCRVKNSPNTACDYYVVAEASASTGYDGWPRTYNDRGRGCVYHPEGKGKCAYLKDDYRHWAVEERQSMCAGNYLANAAAQLRHAIVNDACGGVCSYPQCSRETTRPYCFHCRKCKDNLEHCKEGFKFCNLCREECPDEYEKGEPRRAMGDEL